MFRIFFQARFSVLICSLFCFCGCAIDESAQKLSIRFASPPDSAVFVGSIPISLEIDGSTSLDKEGLQLCVGILFNYRPGDSVSISAYDALRCEQNLSHRDEASIEWRSLPILRFRGIDPGFHLVCVRRSCK